MESSNSMTIVERYHAPIRLLFNTIKKDCSEIEDEEALQISMKSISNSVWPDGLTSTLPFFDALARVGLRADNPTESTFQRAVSLRNATAQMSKHDAKRQVCDALRARNGLNVTDIHTTLRGAPVLVYRPEQNRWDGPYSLFELRDEDVIVLTSKEAQNIRSTVVKPYLNLASENYESIHGSFQQPPPSNALTCKTSAQPVGRFDRWSMLEFNGLIEQGVSKIVPTSEA